MPYAVWAQGTRQQRQKDVRDAEGTVDGLSIQTGRANWRDGLAYAARRSVGS